jgi:glycosyltransferase involved in cell wall biosynthesis
VSEFIAERLVQRGADPDRVVVVPIGVPIPNLSRNSLGTGVLFVGRLVEKKGCVDLLRAMGGLPADLRDTAITIIGDGPERARLESIATTLRVNARFLGAQDPAQVREHMAAARVLCVPSREATNGDSEGLGMVFLEASALATPVVSYVHGGVPEAIVRDKTGLLAPEGDVAQLAELLIAVLKDDQLAAKLGSAGRTFVSAKFDITSCTQSLEELYDRVTDKAQRQKWLRPLP